MGRNNTNWRMGGERDGGESKRFKSGAQCLCCLQMGLALALALALALLLPQTVRMEEAQNLRHQCLGLQHLPCFFECP